MAPKANADEFSDLFSELLHGLRWYRGMTVFLSLLVLVLLFLTYSLGSRPLPDPLVVRVDSVGRAEVVHYEFESATANQSDPVVPYFLTSFVSDHFARRHGYGAERWQRSHHFLTEQLSYVALERDREEITTFMAEGFDAAEQFVENVEVRIIPQPDPPYRAEVFFDRVESYYNAEINRQRFTVSMQFVFAEAIPDESVLVNPLGLVITFLETEAVVIAPQLVG